jgi:hypothetical protein
MDQVEPHHIRHAGVTRYCQVLDALQALSQVSLCKFGITRSCTLRQDSVNSFPADHKADVLTACLVCPD